MSTLMTDLLNLVGNEDGNGVFSTPLSLEEEMKAEIALESEIDAAIYDAEAAAVTAATAVAENIYVAMAEKECGMEGAQPLEVYRSFGLEGALIDTVGQEAISDVVKRRAYSGVASVKSLINTLISWFKRILGLSTNTKKIFKSLGEKSKKIRKDVSKARGSFNQKNAKSGSDNEIERELPAYLSGRNGALTAGTIGLDTVIAVYGAVNTLIQNQSNVLAQPDIGNGSILRRAANGDPIIGSIDRRQSAENYIFQPNTKTEWQERINEWKEDSKTDARGTELFNRIDAGLSYLYTHRQGMRDIDRDVDRCIKHLERVRREMETNQRNRTADTRSAETSVTNVNELLTQLIANLTVAAGFMNMFAKFYVKVADELFTDAKWLIAKAL